MSATELIAKEIAQQKVERFVRKFGEPHKLLAYHAALPLLLTMIVYARNPNSADPPASPSSPSVTLTAFVVAHIMAAVHRTQSHHGISQPGQSKRVNDTVSEMSVAAANHHVTAQAKPKVM